MTEQENEWLTEGQEIYVSEFCPYHGNPDPFVVWQQAFKAAKQSSANEIAEKDKKIADLAAEVERMHLKVGKRLQDENIELTRQNQEYLGKMAMIRGALAILLNSPIDIGAAKHARQALSATYSDVEAWMNEERAKAVDRYLLTGDTFREKKGVE